MRGIVLAIAVFSFAVAGWAPARAAVIDFSATGPETEETCATVANVSYCDDSKFLYGWAADYLLLNDYDFATSVSFTADPGTTFSPTQVDLLYGSNTLLRMRCKKACQDDYYGYAYEHADKFEPVASAFLNVIGLVNGQVVASTSVDPTTQTSLSFGDGFSSIDTLVVAFSGRYPLPYEGDTIFYDGWIYTCASYSCYNVGLDNLSFTPGTPAPVPLPAAGGMLVLASGLLYGLARRRR